MKQNLLNRTKMKNIFLSLAMMLIVGISWGQTNNYFGTSGTITGNVWSTSVGGPYNSALNTTGGAILNFNNTGSATGGSISPMPATWNFGAALTWSAGGTIGAASTNVNFNISSGVLQDFGGSQAFSTAGSAAFTKSGNGALGFVGGTFAGGLTLTAGTLVARGVNAFGSGAVTFNGGTIASNATRTIANPTGITIGGNLQFGEIPANVSLASNTADLSFSDNIALGSSIRTLTLGNAATHTLSGVISGTGGLTFAANANGASGTFALATGNTYAGKTQLTGGRVSGSGEGIFGANPGAFVTDQITFNGGTLSASGNISFSSNRGITLVGTSNTFNTNGNRITLGNIVTGTGGGFTKTGTSGDTLLLNAAHTFTGAVTVSAGYLKLNAAGTYPDASALTVSS
jgi:autotransporter-associated beta strand protein